MLKDQIAPLERAWENYFLKFRYNEFLINEEIYFNILAGCTKLKDFVVGFFKLINVDEDFSLGYRYKYFEVVLKL